MCRSTINMGMAGEVFDCDFNQMLKMQQRNGKDLFLWDVTPESISPIPHPHRQPLSRMHRRCGEQLWWGAGERRSLIQPTTQNQNMKFTPTFTSIVAIDRPIRLHDTHASAHAHRERKVGGIRTEDGGR
jgi:hypothetical protein